MTGTYFSSLLTEKVQIVGIYYDDTFSKVAWLNQR